jgi:hypothetical protein
MPATSANTVAIVSVLASSVVGLGTVATISVNGSNRTAIAEDPSDQQQTTVDGLASMSVGHEDLLVGEGPDISTEPGGLFFRRPEKSTTSLPSTPRATSVPCGWALALIGGLAGEDRAKYFLAQPTSRCCPRPR